MGWGEKIFSTDPNKNSFRHFGNFQSGSLRRASLIFLIIFSSWQSSSKLFSEDNPSSSAHVLTVFSTGIQTATGKRMSPVNIHYKIQRFHKNMIPQDCFSSAQSLWKSRFSVFLNRPFHAYTTTCQRLFHRLFALKNHRWGMIDTLSFYSHRRSLKDNERSWTVNDNVTNSSTSFQNGFDFTQSNIFSMSHFTKIFLSDNGYTFLPHTETMQQTLHFT